MKPIYFPFTYASDDIAEALAACFGQFVIYQPLTDEVPEQMQIWVNEGIMDVRVPVVDDPEELELKVKSYLNWANLQLKGSGVESGFLKTLTACMPFSDPGISSQIVTQIKAQDHGRLTTRATGATLAARIFLYFAQEFDRQSHEVDRDLKWSRQKQENLIRHLKMEEDPLSGELVKKQTQMPDTSTGYMITDRLEAWTRLMQRDAKASGLFVTHSLTIMDHLLDRLPTAQKLLDFKSIPLGAKMKTDLNPWQHTLMSNLTQIVEHKWPVPVDAPGDIPAPADIKKTASLTLYLVPDQMPTDLFCSCSKIERYLSDEADQTGRIKNTLIGIIEL